MRNFFQCKLELHYNTQSKAVQLEVLTEAESEELAIDRINSFYQDVILHPKKTVYIYSKEHDDYVPIKCDAEENDNRLIFVDIKSVKLSNIICFWGNPDEAVYIIKAYLGFIHVKAIQYIAIGAKDFKEACEILTTAFSNPHEIAKQLLLKRHLELLTEADYKDFSYDITSLQRSKLRLL